MVSLFCEASYLISARTIKTKTAIKKNSYIYHSFYLDLSCNKFLERRKKWVVMFCESTSLTRSVWPGRCSDEKIANILVKITKFVTTEHKQVFKMPKYLHQSFYELAIFGKKKCCQKPPKMVKNRQIWPCWTRSTTTASSTAMTTHCHNFRSENEFDILQIQVIDRTKNFRRV